MATMSDDKTDFITTASFNLYVNAVAGLWGANMHQLLPSRWLRGCVILLSLVTDVIVVGNLVLASIRLMSAGVPAAERCISVLTQVTILQSSAKLIYFYVKRHQFQSYTDTWDKCFLNAPFKSKEREQNAAERRNTKRLTTLLIVFYCVPGIPWCALPLIPAIQEWHGERFLAVPLWTPFDVFQSPAYEIVNVLQVVSGTFLVLKNIAFDAYFITLVSLELMQLQHLKYRLGRMFEDSDGECRRLSALGILTTLEDLEDDAKETAPGSQSKSKQVQHVMSTGVALNPTCQHTRKAHNGLRTQASLVTKPHCVKRTSTTTLANRQTDSQLPDWKKDTVTSRNGVLCKTQKTLFMSRLFLWIQHHQETMTLGDEIADLYSQMFALQFITTTLTLCFTSFAVISVKLDGVQYFLLAVYAVCVTIELFMLCHFGDRIVEESAMLSEAVFASGWYKLNCPEINSCIKLVLHRVQKPLRYAGFYGVFPLTSETFYSIMSSAISYLMILIKMHEEN